MDRINKAFAVLLALLFSDVAYVAWVVYFMDQVQGWEGLLVAVFLMPPGILIGFALLAKLIAHLNGTPIGYAKALGFGGLGLLASFVALLIYNGFSQ
jgi:hypothetical protein